MAEKDFTPREMEIMAKAWTCMENEPKVDYTKLAEACGMTNIRSASNAWAAIKKKIMAKGGIDGSTDTNGGGSGTTSPIKKTTTPKATPSKRKKGPASGDGDQDDEESPTKKAKGGKGKAKKSESVVKDEDEESG